MARTSKAFSIAAICLLLAASGAVAETKHGYRGKFADDEQGPPSGAAMAMDVMVARPLGLLTTILGTTFFFIAMPFSALSGDLDTPAQTLVAAPARYTFDRPLGHIDIQD